MVHRNIFAGFRNICLCCHADDGIRACRFVETDSVQLVLARIVCALAVLHLRPDDGELAQLAVVCRR